MSDSALYEIIRSRFETHDAGMMAEHLTASYGGPVHARGQAEPRRAPLSHIRLDAGPFSVDDVRIDPGEFDVSVNPPQGVAVLWVLRGSVEYECAGIRTVAKTGGLILSSHGGASALARTRDVELRIVLINPHLLTEAAADGLSPSTPAQVRFNGPEPVATAAAVAWKEAVVFVRRTVLLEGNMATPLALESAGRMLAALTLAAFPCRTTSGRLPAARAEGSPALLRQAVEFIEANAARDIAVGDIAGAVCLTPRAVQYMFRRHLGTTPMTYLRRIRLQRAHDALTDGDSSYTSVARIATSWGFAHAGRFSSLYRRTYGQSPGTTLQCP